MVSRGTPSMGPPRGGGIFLPSLPVQREGLHIHTLDDFHHPFVMFYFPTNAPVY